MENCDVVPKNNNIKNADGLPEFTPDESEPDVFDFEENKLAVITNNP